MILQAQRDMYQAQPQRCQDQIRGLIINRHVLHANDPGKDNIVMTIEKNTAHEEDEIYEYPTILPEYNDGLLAPKDDGLEHNIRIVD